MDRKNGPSWARKALPNVKRLVTLAVVAQLLNTITLERKITNAAPTQGAIVTFLQAILGAQRAIKNLLGRLALKVYHRHHVIIIIIIIIISTACDKNHLFILLISD